jgi:hypothetical protein
VYLGLTSGAARPRLARLRKMQKSFNNLTTQLSSNLELRLDSYFLRSGVMPSKKTKPRSPHSFVLRIQSFKVRLFATTLKKINFKNYIFKNVSRSRNKRLSDRLASEGLLPNETIQRRLHAKKGQCQKSSKIYSD